MSGEMEFIPLPLVKGMRRIRVSPPEGDHMPILEVPMYHADKPREALVAEYGEDEVSEAEKLVSSDDHRDYMDEHYP